MAPLPVVLAALCLAPAAELKVKPTDWPQFRGPNRDGVSPETGLLKQWPEGGPPKLWTVAGCGEGYSSVSVAGGLIVGAGKKGDKEHVWALDEATGQEKWSTPFAAAPRLDRGGGPRGTPTYASGKVYAVSSDGTLVCVDAATGKPLWSKSYTKDFGGSVPNWGYSESVLVDDGKVIGTPCSKSAAVVALNGDTGEVVWKTQVSDPGRAGGYASAIKTEVAGVPMYVTLLGNSGGVVGVHAKTGKLLWQYTKVMNGVANIPTPIVKGDRVFCSTGYNAGTALIQIVPSADEKFTVTELKLYAGGGRSMPPTVQNHHGGMVLVGEHVYFGSGWNQGYPACVDFKTGEVAWAEDGRPAKGGAGSAAVVAADGMLYFRYQNGVVALIKTDPTNFALVSTFKIPEPSGRESWPHPAIASGKLFLRDQDKLHCFNLKANPER